MKEFDAKLVFYKDCWLYILTVNEIHLKDLIYYLIVLFILCSI